MPLVDITCSKKYFPPDPDLAPAMMKPTHEQQLVDDFGHELPALIVEKAASLNLDPDETPEEGVQVDFHKFHGRAVNPVDVWVKVVFAEPYPGEDIGFEVRATLIWMLTAWRLRNGLQMTGALDIFWGPDHGCLFPVKGETTIFW